MMKEIRRGKLKIPKGEEEKWEEVVKEFEQYKRRVEDAILEKIKLCDK